jgi:serine/threonine protein kinase
MRRFIKPKLVLDPEIFIEPDNSYNTLNNNHETAQCKLLVHQLNQILNFSNYKPCQKMHDGQIIGQGAFGTIYLNSNGTICKRSKTFNKLLEYMKDCDVFSEKIISLLIIILEIPITTEKIRTIINKSELGIHYNIPTNCKLCLCSDNVMAYNIDNVKKQIPIYEYTIPFVSGIDLYKFLMDNEYSYDNLVGIIVQLLYVTMYLNLNGIYHNDIHRKNILICKNLRKINLRGLKINTKTIDIDLDCDYLVVVIDFELAIVTTNIVIPIDFIQGFNMFKNDASINKMLCTNSSFSIMFNAINKIHDEYREEGNRIYEINELNKLPIFDEGLGLLVIEIFDILVFILEKIKTDDIDKYKIKYAKYKQKYLELKKNCDKAL